MTAPTATAEAAAAMETRLRISASRRAQRRFHLFSIISADLIAANVAFYAAYWLRYIMELGGDVPGESFVDYGVYAPAQALFVALCMLGYQMRGSYNLPRGSSLIAEIGTILGSTAVAAMLLFALASLIRYPASSRLTFIYAWVLAILLTVSGRVAIRLVLAKLHRGGHGIERVVVVGNNRLARMVMQMLAQQSQLGYRVVGFVDEAVRSDFGRFRALGAVQSLPQVIAQHQVDRVIVALPAAQHTKALWVLDHCQKDGVSFSLVPDLFELRLSHVNLDTVGGIPLFRLQETSITGWNLFVKRALDVVGSAVLMILLSPVLAVTALAIKLDSHGPILFRQQRLGRNGTPFVCFKFRSMQDRAEDQLDGLMERNEADGPIFKIRDDPRLTRVGRFIRRTSMDEFPQLWNVLRGEMSLVGPRPPIPTEVEQYEEWHRRRLEVVPGMTGLWQVSGRSHLSFDEMVMLDIYYIENWSLGLDLQILTRTIPTVFAAAGAF
ncbi:MAG: undecaprenyl-phosphate glucose phosphotransferase [Chloroflexi bacterium]|nr:undecaprenyl-phosphate glucose phosphotransferase [Chloroflexota bacterium]